MFFIFNYSICDVLTWMKKPPITNDLNEIVQLRLDNQYLQRRLKSVTARAQSTEEELTKALDNLALQTSAYSDLKADKSDLVAMIETIESENRCLRNDKLLLECKVTRLESEARRTKAPAERREVSSRPTRSVAIQVPAERRAVSSRPPAPVASQVPVERHAISSRPPRPRPRPVVSQAPGGRRSAPVRPPPSVSIGTSGTTRTQSSFDYETLSTMAEVPDKVIDEVPWSVYNPPVTPRQLKIPANLFDGCTSPQPRQPVVVRPQVVNVSPEATDYGVDTALLRATIREGTGDDVSARCLSVGRQCRGTGCDAEDTGAIPGARLRLRLQFSSGACYYAQDEGGNGTPAARPVIRCLLSSEVPRLKCSSYDILFSGISPLDLLLLPSVGGAEI
jgi:hypothetical protein